MRSFFRKPFVYTAIFSTVLALFFLYTLLLVFVIPRRADGSASDHDADPFTGVVETGWGNNTPDPPDTADTADTADAEESTSDPFALDPDVEYPLVTDNLQGYIFQFCSICKSLTNFLRNRL